MSMRGGDFSARTGAVGRFSPSVLSRRAILTTGVRRESRKLHPTERSASPTALCGRRAEACGNDLPVVAVDARSGQVQHDAPHGGLDPGTELHEVFAQGAYLGGAKGGARGAQSQLLEQHVRGGGQQSAQLIGEEAAATGAVDFQAVVQLF